jgi:hypothetical protein
MPDMPEFETDREMIDWFEDADLSEADLEPVDVQVAASVTVSLEGPWSSSAATAAKSGTTGGRIATSGPLAAVRE